MGEMRYSSKPTGRTRLVQFVDGQRAAAADKVFITSGSAGALEADAFTAARGQR